MGKMGKQPIRLATAWPGRTDGAERVILCPWLHGPDVVECFWLSLLSWHDANATLLAALPQAHPGTAATVFAGVFCVDPFRRPEALFTALRQAGVAGIANLPSVSFLDGEFATTLEDCGLGTRREIAFLRRAREEGFRIVGCATSLPAAEALADAGAELILAHAGPPLPDRADTESGFAARIRHQLAGRGTAVMSVGQLLATIRC
jgi:hypothetical protein